MRAHLGSSISIVTAIATLWLACPPAAQARRLLSKTGNVTLFADAACAEPAYADSFVLGADVCAGGSGGDNAAVTPHRRRLEPFASFVVGARPWCADGTRPTFNLYADVACGELVASLPPGPPDAADDDGDDDGTCVAPGEYMGVAFLCDGLQGSVVGEEEGEGTSTAMTVTATDSVVVSDTETTASFTAVETSGSTSGIISTTAVPTGGAAITTISSGPLMFLAYTLIIGIIAI